jgi:CRP/FNR family cyclic AMP-dependent transcriptional regulator
VRTGRGLSRREAAAVAGIKIFQHARDTMVAQPGQVIFEQGAPGDVMYAVIEGRVDIVLDGVVLESVDPGGIVGELALVDAGPRSAGAVARTESKLARVDQKEFEFLVQEHPTFAIQVMRVLAERIRHANATR